MSYGSLNNSSSNPSLQAHPLSNSQAGRVPNSTSLANLQQNYQVLSQNVQEIRQVDHRLKQGIQFTREKLVRVLHTGEQHRTGSLVQVHSPKVINEAIAQTLVQVVQPRITDTVTKNVVTWQGKQETFRRDSRFGQPVGDNVRNGGVSLGPTTPAQVIVNPNINVRSKQRSIKVGEDAYQLKRIIEQKNVLIQQLQIEITNLNIRITQLSTQGVAGQKCRDCDRYAQMIRQLELKYGQLAASVQSRQGSVQEHIDYQGINKIVADLRSMSVERDHLRVGYERLEREKNTEITALRAQIDRLRSENTGRPASRTNQYEDKYSNLQINQYKLTIDQLRIELEQKNYHIRQVQSQLQQFYHSGPGNIALGSGEHAIGYDQDVVSKLQLQIREAQQQLHVYSEREEQYESMLKSAEQYQFLNEKYAREIQSKQQTIIQLNERIGYLAGRLNIGEGKQSPQKPYGEGDNRKTLLQGEPEEAYRELSVKVYILEAEIARLQNQIAEDQKIKLQFRTENEELARQVSVLRAEQHRWAVEGVKKSHDSFSSQEETAEFKGYHYSNKLDQLQKLLQRNQFVELSQVISRSMNEKKSILQKVIRSTKKNAVDDREIVELGKISYALDEMLSRFAQKIEYTLRSTQRIKAERDAFNNALIEAEITIKKRSGASQHEIEQISRSRKRIEQSSMSNQQQQINQLKNQLYQANTQWQSKYQSLRQELQTKQKSIKQLKASLSQTSQLLNSRNALNVGAGSSQRQDRQQQNEAAVSQQLHRLTWRYEELTRVLENTKKQLDNKQSIIVQLQSGNQGRGLVQSGIRRQISEVEQEFSLRLRKEVERVRIEEQQKAQLTIQQFRLRQTNQPSTQNQPVSIGNLQQVHNLRQTIMILEGQIKTQQSQRIQMLSTIKSLENQVSPIRYPQPAASNQDNAQLGTRIRLLEDQIKTLERNLSEKDKQLKVQEAYEPRIRSLEQQLQSEREAYEPRIRSLEQQLQSERQEHQRVQANYSLEIEALSRNHQGTRAQLFNSESMVAQLQNQLRGRSSGFIESEIQRQRRLLQEQFDVQIRREIEGIRQEEERLTQTKIEEFKRNYKQQNVQRVEATVNKDQIQLQIRSLQTSLQSQRQQFSRTETRLRSQLTEANRLLSVARTELQQKVYISNFKPEQKHPSQTFDSSTSPIKSGNQQQKDSNNQQSTIAGLQRELINVQNQWRAKFESLQRQFINKETRIRQLESQQGQKTPSQQPSTLVDSRVAGADQLSRLREEFGQREKQWVSKLESANNELSTRSRIIGQLQAKVKTVVSQPTHVQSNEIIRLRQELKKHESAYTSLQATLTDKINELARSYQHAKTGIEERDIAITNLEQQLRGQGRSFIEAQLQRQQQLMQEQFDVQVRQEIEAIRRDQEKVTESRINEVRRGYQTQQARLNDQIRGKNDRVRDLEMQLQKLSANQPNSQIGQSTNTLVFEQRIQKLQQQLDVERQSKLNTEQTLLLQIQTLTETSHKISTSHNQVQAELANSQATMAKLQQQLRGQGRTFVESQVQREIGLLQEQFDLQIRKEVDAIRQEEQTKAESKLALWKQGNEQLVRDHEASLRRLQDQIQERERENSVLVQNNRSLEQKLQAAPTQKYTDQYVVDLQATIKNLEDRLQAKDRELVLLTQNYQQLQQQLQTSRKPISDPVSNQRAQQQIKNLEQQLQSQRQQNQRNKAQINQQLQAVLQQNEAISRDLANRDDAIRGLQNQLRGQGSHFIEQQLQRQRQLLQEQFEVQIRQQIQVIRQEEQRTIQTKIDEFIRNIQTSSDNKQRAHQDNQQHLESLIQQLRQKIAAQDNSAQNNTQNFTPEPQTHQNHSSEGRIQQLIHILQQRDTELNIALAQLHSVNQKAQKYTELNGELHRVIEFRDSEIVGLKTALTHLQTQNVRLVSETSRIQTHSKELSDDKFQSLSKAEQEIERLHRQNIKLAEHTASISAEVERLRTLYDDLQRTKQQQNSYFRAQILSLNEQSQANLVDISGRINRERDQQEQRQVEKTKQSITVHFTALIKDLENQIKVLKEKLAQEVDNKSEIIRLQTQNKLLKEKINQMQSMILLYSNQQVKVQKLESQNQKILQQLRFLNQELKRLTNQLQRLSSELHQATAIYESEKYKISNELQETRQKKDQIYQSLLRAENYIEKCEMQIENLKKLVEEEGRRAKEEIARKQILEESSELQTKTLENSRLEQELKAVLVRSETEKNLLQSEIKNLKQQLKSLQQKIFETDRNHSDKVSRSGQTQLLVAQLQQQNLMLKQKLQQLEESNIRLNSQSEIFKQQLEKTETMLRSQQSQNLSLSKDLNRIQAINSSNLRQKQQLESRLTKISSIEQQHRNLQANYQKLLTSLQQLDEQESSLADSSSVRRRPIFSTDSRSGENREQVEASLARVSNKLADNNRKVAQLLNINNQLQSRLKLNESQLSELVRELEVRKGETDTQVQSLVNLKQEELNRRVAEIGGLQQQNVGLRSELSITVTNFNNLVANLKSKEEKQILLLRNNQQTLANLKSLENKLELMENQLKTQQQSRQGLASQNAGLKQELNTLVDNFNKLVAELQQKSAQESALVQNNQRLISSVKQLEQQLTAVKSQQQSAQMSQQANLTIVNQLRAQITAKDEQNAKVKTDNNNLVEQINQLVEELNKVGPENALLKNELANLGNDANLMATNLKNKQARQAQLIKKNQAVIQDLGQIELKLSNLQHQYQQIEKQLLANDQQLALKNQIIKLKQQSELKYEKRVEEYQILIGKLQAEQHSEKETLTRNVSQQIQVRETEISILRQEQANLREQVNGLRQENLLVTQESSNLKNEVSLQGQTIGQLRSDNNGLIQERKNLENQVAELTASSHRLQEQLLTHEIHLDELTLLLNKQKSERASENNVARIELEKAQVQRNILATEVQNLKQEIDLLRKRNTELETELERAIKDANSFADELRLRDTRESDLVQENRSIGAQRQSLEEKLNRLQAEFDNLSSQKDSLIQTLKQKQLSQIQNIARVEQLSHIQKTLTQETTGFKVTIGELTNTLNIERAQRQAQIQALQVQLQDLNNDNNSLKNELNVFVNHSNLLSAEVKKKEQVEAQLVKQNQAVVEDLRLIQTKLITIQQQYDNLRVQLQNEQQGKLQQIEQSYVGRIQQLDKQRQDLLVNIEQLSRLKDIELGQQVQLVTQLRTENANLIDQVAQLRQDIMNVMADVDNLANQGQSKEVVINIMSGQIEQIAEEVGQFQHQLPQQTTLVTEIGVVSKLNQAVWDKLEDMASQLQRAEGEIRRLEEENRVLGGKFRNKIEAEVIEETNKFKVLLLESNNKITQLMNTNNQLSIRLQIHEERVKEQIKQIEQEIEEQQSRRSSSAEAQLRNSTEITQRINEIENLNIEVEKLHMELSRVKGDANMLAEQLKLKSLRETILIRENEEILNNLKGIEQKLAGMESAYEQVRNQSQNSELQHTRSREELQDRVKNLESENYQYKAQLEEINRRQGQNQGQKDQEIKRLALQISELTILNSNNQGLILSLEEQINKINQELNRFAEQVSKSEVSSYQPSNRIVSVVNQVVWDKINTLQKQNQALNEKAQKMAEIQAIQERYEQVLSELTDYERLNKKLSEQVERLSQEVNKYRIKVEQFSKHAMDSSNENNSSSAENIQLRKKLERAEQIINRLKLPATYELTEQRQIYNNILDQEEQMIRLQPENSLKQFLRENLRKITSLEESINYLQAELTKNNEKLGAVIDDLSSEESTVMRKSQLKVQLQQLDQLENQLLQNEKEINESCENLDNAIRDIKQVIESEDQSAVDKEKLKDLFTLLESNIRQNQKLHEQEIQSMALVLNQADKSQRYRSEDEEVAHLGDEEVGFRTQRIGISDRAQLIREVKQLSKLIDTYHRQAQRRKSQHFKVVSAVKAEIGQMKQIYGEMVVENEGKVEPGGPADRILSKISTISIQLETELDRLKRRQDDQRESSGFGQIADQQIHGQGSDHQMIESVRESLNENTITLTRPLSLQQFQNMLIQANFETRPFLDYILQNNQFDRAELMELKRRIALLKSRETKQNLAFLSERKAQIERVLEQHHQRSVQNVDIDRLMQIIADNAEQQEISQFFQAENNHILISRIGEALNISQSRLTEQSNVQRLQSHLGEQIKQIMLRHYPQPNKLSQALYQFILLILVAPNDEALLGIIDNIFGTVLEIEQVYISAIDEKDRIFKEHSDMMKRVLEKSSSEESEELMGEEGENLGGSRQSGFSEERH